MSDAFVKVGEDTVWPNPLDPNDVEWQLRYGDPEMVRLLAASFVSAYRHLATRPEGVRSLRDLRREMKKMEVRRGDE